GSSRYASAVDSTTTSLRIVASSCCKHACPVATRRQPSVMLALHVPRITASLAHASWRITRRNIACEELTFQNNFDRLTAYVPPYTPGGLVRRPAEGGLDRRCSMG